MSKSNSKGSSARIGTLLEQLQKLCLAGSDAKHEQEKADIEQLRYVTSKIQQLLSSQEKCRKDLTTKFADGLSTLLVVLEMSVDTQLTLNILGCLCELLTTGKRAAVLVAKGTVDIILRVIVNTSKEASVCEEILLLSHVILTKVGPKDRKLCVKARLTGALQVTMNLIKNNTTFFKVLQPALQVLKLYSANSVNCNALAKLGAVNVLFRVITSCGHKRVICLKSVLEIIATLVKSKSCASKAVSFGAVPVLLQLFCDWQRTDHHHRQANIRKAILNVIKNITLSRAGKKAFIQADGIKTLYTSSLETLECRELEGVNNLSSQILRRCFPTNKLPVSSLSSPLAFALLDLDSAGNSSAEDLLDDSGEGESSEIESEDDDDESGSTSQEDKESCAKTEKLDSNSTSNVDKQTKAKPRDDLAMYEKFFPELFELQVEDDEPVEDEHFVSYPIVIPTAAEEPLSTSPTGLSQLLSQQDSRNFESPPSQSKGSQPKTQAIPTQEKLVEKQRPGHTGNPAARKNGHLQSVLSIIKTPSPDMYGHYPPLEPEPLGQKKTGLQRTMIFKDIERQINPQRVINRVVFDLDSLLKQETEFVENSVLSVPAQQMRQTRKVSNTSMSEGERSSPEETARPLKFESRFESGNLRKAIQVRDYEYDLVLNPDINCKHHHQWFFFEVSNMEGEIPYKFNIVNCEKINSQFNFGMQPVMYSTLEAQEGRAGWVRTGTNVCYYRNYFTRSREATGGQGGKTYYTSTFTVSFPHTQDACYFAYHYPYTFTMLQSHLSRLESSLNTSDIYYRRMTLCDSLAGNPCDVITITAQPRQRDANTLEMLKSRPYIFLTSRVHPGESNSSWVMKGVLDFLMSNFYTARRLRETFIFKIVPMLNMDGVINGCHRCSLSGDDLNRRWISPSMLLHPTIYHVKGLLLYLQSIEKTPLVYCDFHGHSRKKNVFMYGCSTVATMAAAASPGSGDVDSELIDSVRERVTELSGSDSTSSMDPADLDEDPGYRTLPRVLHNIAPAFSLGSCSFIVEQSKESTARVVVWREIGVVRSYTMETTYSGCDQGPYKGYHVGTRELEEMGRFFCAGLLRVGRSYFYRNSNHGKANDSSSESPTADSSWIRTSELFVPCELVSSGVVV
ncbi:cytosolic carboxypeptidase 1-like [Montipora capricornis]|uniref:cytosolic carboxypeptidase 1-like n=1 Tax=Montipora capricornis TaxID=246305 RepID=UPI0035F15912